MIVHVTVPGEPVPKGRPRFGANGSVYTDARTEAEEQRVGWLWKKEHRGPPTAESVAVSMLFVRGTARHVDVDNLAKLVLDALNTIAWVDDHQVLRMTAEKRRSLGADDPPRTEVWVAQLGNWEGETDDPSDPEDELGGDAAGARLRSIATHPCRSGAGVPPGKRRQRR